MAKHGRRRHRFKDNPLSPPFEKGYSGGFGSHTVGDFPRNGSPLVMEPAASAKIQRYRQQSLRLLDSALTEMRSGRWLRSEELLWGSLTLAVKAVALTQGDEIEGDEAIREYASRLGQKHRDRRIREAFKQLSGFSDTVDRVLESRSRMDYLFLILDDISSAIERLWELVPVPEPPAPESDEIIDELPDEITGSPNAG